VFTPADLKWGPASPALPPGAQATVLEGDPTKEGMFTIRVKVPAGYKVAPHRHPALERVTVISGTFHVGIGEAFDETKGKTLPAGSFSLMPSGDAHFAWASEETVLQITCAGPWDVLYVNPADDPRTKKHGLG
jgi:quercetin dioxygenase-like cupin family protein